MGSGIDSKSEKTMTSQMDKNPEYDGSTNKRFFKKNIKEMSKNSLFDKKNSTGETTDMNVQLFQTIEESRDATQYVKMVEALE